MSLARELNVEDNQKTDKQKLKFRLELLKSQGWNDSRIARDPKVRQIKARIRKGRQQIERLAALKKQIAETAEATAIRRAEAKATSQMAQMAKMAKTAAPEAKKPKKKKKPVADED